MEADHGRLAADERGRLECGVREISCHSAIRPGQRRHGPGRIPGHLLVGMGASAAGSADRRSLRPAVRRLPDPAPDAPASDRAVRGAARPRRPAGADRLVDGVQRPVRAGRCGAGAAGGAPRPGVGDLHGVDLDRAGGLERRIAQPLAGGLEPGRGRAVGRGLRAMPAGRAGGGSQGRLRLHRLAADERGLPGAGGMGPGRSGLPA